MSNGLIVMIYFAFLTSLVYNSHVHFAGETSNSKLLVVEILPQIQVILAEAEIQRDLVGSQRQE